MSPEDAALVARLKERRDESSCRRGEGEWCADLAEAAAARIETLARERDTIAAHLASIQWSALSFRHQIGGPDPCCPVCRRTRDETHLPDCWLAAALRPTQEPQK